MLRNWRISFLRSSWQLRLNDLMRMLLSRICLTVGLWRRSRSWRLSRFFDSQSSTSQCSKRFRPMDLFDFCDESPTSAPLPHSRSTPVAVASRMQFTFRKQSAPAMVAQPSRKSNLPTTTSDQLLQGSACCVLKKGGCLKPQHISVSACWSRTLSNWMSAPTAPGAAASQGSRIATVRKVSGSPSSECIGTLPKPGENWAQHSAWDTFRSCLIALRHA